MTLLTPMRLSVLVCLFGLVMARAQNSPTAIETIEFRGINRVPEDTLRATILSKAGDVYSEQAVRRDFMALWNTGRFDDIQVEKETGARGGVVVRFVVTERPEQPQQTLPTVASNVIEGIEFRGARRIPQDTLRVIIGSRVGDLFDEDAVRRDFSTLWNTGRFDDIQIGKETGARGGVIVRFIVTERPLR